MVERHATCKDALQAGAFAYLPHVLNDELPLPDVLRTVQSKSLTSCSPLSHKQQVKTPAGAVYTSEVLQSNFTLSTSGALSTLHDLRSQANVTLQRRNHQQSTVPQLGFHHFQRSILASRELLIRACSSTRAEILEEKALCQKQVTNKFLLLNITIKACNLTIASITSFATLAKIIVPFP